jgi:cell division protease FtsH
MPAPRESGPHNRPRRRPEPMPGGWLWIIALPLFGIFIYFLLTAGSPGTINYNDFVQLAKDDKFINVVIRGTTSAVGELKEGEALNLRDDLKKHVKSSRFVETNIQEKLIDNLTKHLDGHAPYRFEAEAGAWLVPFFYVILPMLFIVGFFVLFILPRLRDPLGGGFLSSYIKSPARRYDKSKMRVTFQDVADMQYAKSELQEIVEFLKNPEKFQRLGAQIPKGVLLEGAPGTGKTLLARAVAGEAGVPFFSISGSEFIQMFVGVGASRVRDMFRTAKENAPCLLFIDEIDAVGRMRGAGVGGGSDEREQTLNQILSEMDGFTPTESVIVIAATNRPDVLDSALLRPGRFDRHVTIDRPTWRGRLEILKVHTRNKPLADDVNLEGIARRMIGMTGADLRNLANEAALIATRDNKPRIEREDFERAADRVLLGAKREEILNEEEKRRTAYHEAGHALVIWLSPECDPLQKVTIVPRGHAGGVTWFAPDEDRYHRGLDYYKSKLSAAMGGRASERLIFNQPYSGVEQDLKEATRIARYMVTHWGMSDRLGPMSFRVGEEHIFLGKEIQEPRDFSEHSASVIDEEVQKLLREADERAFQLLESNRDKLELIVDALMQREELIKEEIDQIMGTGKPLDNGKPDEGIIASQPAAV